MSRIEAKFIDPLRSCLESLLGHHFPPVFESWYKVKWEMMMHRPTLVKFTSFAWTFWAITASRETISDSQDVLAFENFPFQQKFECICFLKKMSSFVWNYFYYISITCVITSFTLFHFFLTFENREIPSVEMSYQNC